MGRLGRALALLWLAGPLLGWLPRMWLVAAESWWWLATSVVVLAIASRTPPTLHLREPSWIALGLVGLVACWTLRIPDAVAWLAQVLLWALAGLAIVERWGWHPLRQAVIALAWLQVPVVLAQQAGWTLYPALRGLCGTVGYRSVLGVLWGLVSLWSPGRLAWYFMGLSACTGSWTGFVIPLVRLLPLRWRHPLTWITLVGLTAGTWRLWGLHLTSHLAVWRTIGWWTRHWLTGFSFQELPSGFRENFTLGNRWVEMPITDLHNTWLDALVHGGVLGLLLLLVVMGWAAWRSRQVKTLWTWAFAAWVLTWQSVGSRPSLFALGLVWLVSLCHPGRRHADSVHALG